MRVRAIVVITCLLSLVVACKRAKGPTKLFDGLYSYASPQQAQDRLDVRRDQWHIVEDRRPLPTDTRPPFYRLRVNVTRYKHHGVEGRLELLFFNERLMATHFYPEDLEAYKVVLRQRENLVFDRDLGKQIDIATWVWIGRDTEGLLYVGWRDNNLKSEMDEWVKTYS